MRNNLGVGVGQYPAFILLMLAGLLSAKASAETLRDPTRPLGQSVASVEQRQQELTLESVLIGPSRRLAIINGQTVSLHESVLGAEVIEIAAGRVTLMAQGRKQQLWVTQPLNKMQKATGQ